MVGAIDLCFLVVGLPVLAVVAVVWIAVVNIFKAVVEVFILEFVWIFFIEVVRVFVADTVERILVTTKELLILDVNIACVVALFSAFFVNLIRGFDDNMADIGIFVDIANIFKEDLVQTFVVKGAEYFFVDEFRDVVVNLLWYKDMDVNVGLIKPVREALILDSSGIITDDADNIFVTDGVINSFAGVVEACVTFLLKSDVVDVRSTLLEDAVDIFVVDANGTFAVFVVRNIVINENEGFFVIIAAVLVLYVVGGTT